MPAPPSRYESAGRRLAIVTVLALSVPVGMGLYAHLKGASGEPLSGAGFDLSSVAPRPAPAAPASSFERALPPSSPAPLIGELPDGSRAIAGVAGEGGGAVAPARRASDARERERRFLARHGAELRRYHARLDGIAMRYRRTHAVVREVDEAFGRMPRYMAVKARFERDRDPFSFVRDGLALPEVRAEISRRLRDGRAWSAALGMLTDALREAPPPRAFYDEALAFLGREEKVAEQLSRFAEEASAQAPAIVAAVPPGADLRRLQKMLNDATAATAKR